VRPTMNLRWINESLLTSSPTILAFGQSERRIDSGAMLELEEALARILAMVPPAVSERVVLGDAHERVLTEPVFSDIDLPPFDNSAMDGYAVRAEDVAGAKPDLPARLRLVGRVAAGEMFDGEITGGTCVRLFTGSPLPRGADAVVMQEDTRVEAGEEDFADLTRGQPSVSQSEQTDPSPRPSPLRKGRGRPAQAALSARKAQRSEAEYILVFDSAKPWENVRLRGEDVKRGGLLAEAGTVLSVGRISLLAAAGCPSVSVGRRPIVGLLATGSELRESGEEGRSKVQEKGGDGLSPRKSVASSKAAGTGRPRPFLREELAPGQIYESNRIGLAALIRRAGAVAKIWPVVPDALAPTRMALAQAFKECDVVVTCGGASVGEMDFIKKAFEEEGGNLNFWKVAIKPGRPLVFGQRGGKLLFGLPGNPVSALVTFLLLARPALLRWQGAREVGLVRHPGTLAEPLSNGGERRHFVRVKVDPMGNVHSAGIQASHVLSSIAAANGLVDVPPNTTLAAGTRVTVLRWEH
jgi:molybdopterin molybdotransferase